MSKSFARRHFFKTVLQSAFRNVETSAGETNHEETRGGETIPEDLPDLTPELLKLEAERLGLDPARDRSLVIRSIRAALTHPNQ